MGGSTVHTLWYLEQETIIVMTPECIIMPVCKILGKSLQTTIIPLIISSPTSDSLPVDVLVAYASHILHDNYSVYIINLV